MKRLLIAAIACCLALPTAAQDVMRNIADVTGQPDTALLEQWKAQGVATVINMRTPEEMAALDYDEEAAVRALGMEYVSIPLSPGAPTPEIAAALAAALDAAEGPVALHCASGNRAANALAAIEIERGADPQSMESLVEGIGLNPGLLRGLSPRYAEAMSSAPAE